LPISPEEFLKRLEKEQDKILDQAEWMPGALKLMHHLYKARNESFVAYWFSYNDSRFNIFISIVWLQRD